MGAAPRKGSRRGRSSAHKEGTAAAAPREAPEPEPSAPSVPPEEPAGTSPEEPEEGGLGSYPRAYEGGLWFSAMEFGPGSRLALDLTVEAGDIYAGFLAQRQDASRYVLFNTMGDHELVCITGAGSARPEAPRARRAMPEGRHKLEIDWGETTLRWSVDGETMHEAAEAYDGGGVPHQVVVRAGTRVTVHRAPTVNNKKVA